MFLESMSFRLGERKEVRVLVENTSGKDCYISSASYELCCGQEVEEIGECHILQLKPNKSILTAIISPQRANASYKYRITYAIGDEVYIYDCLIRVFGRCDDVQ